MEEHKLDIFEALSAVDRRDGDWFGQQPEDARKTFAPPVFVRWASTINGSAAADTLMMTNEFVNVNLWEIASEHPELVFRLAAMCGAGTRQRHEWLAMAGRKRAANKAYDLLCEFHRNLSENEIDLMFRLHTRVSFLAFVDDTGVPPETAKEAMKAYDKLAKVQ